MATIAGAAPTPPEKLPQGLVKVISRATPATLQEAVPPDLAHLPKSSKPDSFETYVEDLKKWQKTPWLGTGTVIDDKGYLLVSSQLVEHKRILQAELAPGKWLPARLVGLDPMCDLAVVRVREPRPPAARLANVQVAKGEAIIAAGYPAGRPEKFAGTILYPGTRRTINSLEVFLLSDLKQRSGMAGGLLLNQKGEAVAWIVGPDRAVPLSPSLQKSAPVPQPLYALPGARVKTIAQGIIANGYYPRPYVGLRLIKRRSGEGLEVLRVVGASPADKAGLRGGDILLQLGGRSIPDEDWLRRRMLPCKPGDLMVFTVQRQDETLEVTVNLSYFGRQDELRL
jgi:S1-C subfamily serine protease